MRRNYLDLGSFEMQSSVMRISDPTYKKNVWCTATLDNCMTGNWTAAVGMSDEGEFGNRVGILMARHETGPKFHDAERIFVAKEEDGLCYLQYPSSWNNVDADIGVDSACCGMYDDATYEPTDWFDTWPGAIVGNGCISSSGYGDGSYMALYHANADGEVDAVCVVYI